MQSIEREQRRKRIIELLSGTAAVVLLYVILAVVGIGCPIKYITGVSCAGCGMTRAYVALFHFDFAKAFYYHPLFLLPPVAVLTMLLKNKISIKFYRAIWFTIVVAFVIVYLYRMLVGGNDIVVFRPQDGLIGREIRRIKF